MADRSRTVTTPVYNKAGVQTGTTTSTENYTVKRGTSDAKRPGYPGMTVQGKRPRGSMHGILDKHGQATNYGRNFRKPSKAQAARMVFPMAFEDLKIFQAK